MGFLIIIYGSGLAVPFLFSNIKILACLAFDETYDCFAGTQLTLFILNVITLFLFLCLYYFYTKCLDLNYHIPVEHYQAPWSLLRP